MAYLFEWPNDREAETIRRLLGGPHCAYDYFWTTLGVRHPTWFGINLPKRTLLGDWIPPLSAEDPRLRRLLSIYGWS